MRVSLGDHGSPLVLGSAARTANAGRNRGARPERAVQWRDCRDRVWKLLARHLRDDARVAIVGAGNCQDIPLTRIARRAASVDLFDIDPHAIRSARDREPEHVRSSVIVHQDDVTAGLADVAIRAASRDRSPRVEKRSAQPLVEGAFDLVIGDLFYTQLIYPALLDLDVSSSRIESFLRENGQPITDFVVERLHRSAPSGLVVHIHDPLGWWEGHDQPWTLDHVLECSGRDIERLRPFLATGNGPLGCDVFSSLGCINATVIDLDLWRWPFANAVDYLVCALVAKLD